MNYKEQYKHPKWQKKRLEILNRDEFACTNCGSDSDNLHVHHYLYHKDKKVWEYENGYLTTFCFDCHEQWHDINDHLKEFLKLDVVRLNHMLNIVENLYGLKGDGLSKINDIITNIRFIKKLK